MEGMCGVSVCILTTSLLLAGSVSGDARAADATGKGTVRVLSAYYMPDPRPPADSNNVEGNVKPPDNGAIFQPLQRLYKEHADFGGARVVLFNDSRSEARIGQVKLNGKPIEESYVDFLNGNWGDRGVVWYRVRPRTLAPGQCGEIYIRFRRRPAGTRATVSVVLDDGKSLEAVFRYSDPGVCVDYVTTDRSGRRLYVYARRSRKSLGQLRDLMLDGREVENARIYGADFPGNVALTVVELPKPLETGDYHVAQVTTSSGQTVAAQFRVLPFFFMRWSFLYFANSAEEVRELGMNFTDFRHNLSLEKAEELGVYTGSDGSGVHARQIWAWAYDEPDAKDQHPDFGQKQLDRFLRKEAGHVGKPVDDSKWRDLFPGYTGVAYAVGLGRNARETILAENKRVEEERFPLATYLITDGTTRPLNWFVYGQVTDIAGTDPYPVNMYGGDLTTVREQYTLMRQASTPRPTYACLESYTENTYLKESPDALRRAPSGPEFRQMAVQALGCGAKGYTSWFWGNGSGMTGAGSLPHLRAEYIRLNKLTEHIENELLLGTPADIVRNDAGLTKAGSFYFLEEGPYKLKKLWMKERVWTSALLCGTDAIIITAANHLPASRVTPGRIEPAQNVNITVQLPGFLRDVECFEVDDTGLHLHPCRTERGKAVITLDAIESGRIFLLRRKL